MAVQADRAEDRQSTGRGPERMITLALRDEAEAILHKVQPFGQILPDVSNAAGWLAQSYTLWDLSDKIQRLALTQDEVLKVQPGLQILIDHLPPVLWLIRGLPGSGKSTLAHRFIDHFMHEWARPIHVENDMFRMQDGVYVFQHGQNQAVHMLCLGTTYEALQQRRNVVVSNTFCLRATIRDYQELAEETGAHFMVHECHGAYANIHDVPEDTIQAMKASWEPWP